MRSKSLSLIGEMRKSLRGNCLLRLLTRFLPSLVLPLAWGRSPHKGWWLSAISQSRFLGEADVRFHFSSMFLFWGLWGPTQGLRLATRAVHRNLANSVPVLLNAWMSEQKPFTPPGIAGKEVPSLVLLKALLSSALCTLSCSHPFWTLYIAWQPGKQSGECMHVPSDYHFGEHLAMNMLNSYLCCASRSCPKLEKDWKAEEVCVVTEPSHTVIRV